MCYTAMSSWNTKCSHLDFRCFWQVWETGAICQRACHLKNTFWLQINETRVCIYREKAKGEAGKNGKKKNHNSIACLRLYCCKPGFLTKSCRKKERVLETTCGQYNEERLGSCVPGTGIHSLCV